MKLIVGIGNPGKEYENTRHNIGFIALDQIARKHNVDFNENVYEVDLIIDSENKNLHDIIIDLGKLNEIWGWW